MMRLAPFLRFLLPVLALLTCSAVVKGSTPVLAVTTRLAFHAGLRGEVRAGSNGLPVVGAHVSVPGLGLSIEADRFGHFRLPDIPLGGPLIPITVTVSAPGFGDWSVQNVLLAADDTLILTPELNDEPFLEVLPLPESIPRSLALAWKWNLPTRPATVAQAEFTLPEKIRVRMTGKWQCDPSAPYRVVTVDFKDYVKHVLPNEWYYFWPRESLKAGAMVVKMYAWYFIAQGGKWENADVFDNTCDQWYQPFLTRESTNRAVDSTWNWQLTRKGALFPTYHKDIEACDPPFCMRQTASALLARQGYTWDEILEHFYAGSALTPLSLPPAGHALHFNGTPGDSLEANRLTFRLDSSPTQAASPGVNVGESDFTIEWWLKVFPEDNRASPIQCGSNSNWIYGNILLDRSRPEDRPGFGVSLASGRPAFGVTGEARRSLTICGSTPVDDGKWHHLAVQRRSSDGRLWIFVDGKLSASGMGPAGDISYPGSYESAYPDREPILSFGGWKDNTDHQQHPFFQGTIDEIRFSSILRYSEAFSPAQEVFQPDDDTQALFHLDEGLGKTVHDATGRAGDGFLLFGGMNAGPEWVLSSLFTQAWTIYLPSLNVDSP